MARVTPAEVREILPDDTTLTDVNLNVHITAAMCIVDDVATGCGSRLTTACLKEVERYLAAHFAAVQENTLTIKSETDPCCGGRATYGFEFGQGIMGTPYGQSANTLSCGCLAQYDKTPISVHSIGTHGNC